MEAFATIYFEYSAKYQVQQVGKATAVDSHYKKKYVNSTFFEGPKLPIE